MARGQDAHGWRRCGHGPGGRQRPSYPWRCRYPHGKRDRRSRASARGSRRATSGKPAPHSHLLTALSVIWIFSTRSRCAIPNNGHCRETHRPWGCCRPSPGYCTKPHPTACLDPQRPEWHTHKPQRIVQDKTSVFSENTGYILKLP